MHDEEVKATPLFLLGFHRGGTTFVQRLLNCHTDVVLWGENGGLLSRLREIQQPYEKSGQPVKVREYREFTTFAGKFVPWANPFSGDDLAVRIADFLRSLYAVDGVGFWGFKEIRNSNVADIEFLCRLFEPCRIALLVRHPRDVLMSDFLVRWSSAKSAESVETFVRGHLSGYCKGVTAFAEAAERWPAQVRMLRYESINGLDAARGVFATLGIPPEGLDEELLGTVLDARAGSSFGDAGRQVDETELTNVRELYERLIGPTMDEACSSAALSAIRPWYPDL